ncbi:MetQ/NlpA family ABC transporter substrate-binding protein [Brucella pituitosa]|uniref:Iron ABC transporter substrate-binding protein n=1 Tax=Brucella pituitosa TaxID=571256 RepID=A0A643F821_9HYPH|nr:MetQ/NlpA family ABC transporter substrate-binding protein [Brucella pituitosa]KAB0573188.1 iron ABC transporter substrate-binding protein [Brucella pituitosa]
MTVLPKSTIPNISGKLHRRRFLLLSAAILFGLSLPAGLHAEEKGTLRIALATSISNQAAEIAAAEAKEQGLNVELVEFSDWNTPNTAVADKTVDANLFQHIPYLNYTNSNTGNGLVPVAPAFSTPFGLYSKKYSKLEDLPDNAQIVFSGDVINTARSLLLLQQAGFLELKPGTDQRASLEDVLTWKKPLKIVLLDGPQIARSLDDVDAAATYPTFAKLAGLEASSGLIFENEPIYAFQFVTRPELRDDPRLRQFIEIYQNSPAVKAKLHELYGDMVSFPR